MIFSKWRLANSKPFSLLEQPLTAFAKISYGKQDYATVISSNWEKEQWQIKPALLKMMLSANLWKERNPFLFKH